MTNEQKNYDITWVGLLEIRDRKLLLTREKGKTLYQLPGGGQENNETILNTLKREIFEELNVTLKNCKSFDDFILPGRNEGVLIRFIIYTAEIIGTIKPGKDIEEIRWVNSTYQKEFLDIGNPPKLRVIPRLLDEKLID